MDKKELPAYKVKEEKAQEVQILAEELEKELLKLL